MNQKPVPSRPGWRSINKYRKKVNYEIGNKVYLFIKNIKITRLYKKLNYKIIGPYKIVGQIGYLYKLKLPETFGINNVFYTALLRIAAKNPLPN